MLGKDCVFFLFYFNPQMKLLLLVVASLVAVCLAEPKPAINEVKSNQPLQKPGRFLSLPVPEKCASREYLYKKRWKLEKQGPLVKQIIFRKNDTIVIC